MLGDRRDRQVIHDATSSSTLIANFPFAVPASENRPSSEVRRLFRRAINASTAGKLILASPNPLVRPTGKIQDVSFLPGSPG
jgi:hypothetical protein